jgi:hypothetical protein
MPASGYRETKPGRFPLVCFRLGKRTSEPIAAAHNDHLVGNGCFAIRFPSFASSTVNGNLGSILAIEKIEFRRW